MALRDNGKLTINGTEYKFKAGMMFLKDIGKRYQAKNGSIVEDVGFEMRVSQLIAGDPEALVDILHTANTGFDPVCTVPVLERYLEDECEDPEALFTDVQDFLSGSNCCKVKMQRWLAKQEKASKNG